MVLSLFRRRRGPDATSAPAKPGAGVPDGLCVYAIGDVHGRPDLLSVLLQRIAQDVAARKPEQARVVLLGDLIDRGEDSKSVIDMLLAMDWGMIQPDYLIGNHEEMMLSILDGSTRTMRLWMRHGGEATLLSYGVPSDTVHHGTEDEIVTAFARVVPPEHLRFLRAMKDSIAIGDYLFVHAGVRPGVPLDRQKASDMRWIRGEFLDHAGDHGAVVVHGHTVTEGIDEQPNRIGIDTGAYATGRLTAIGLSGAERWFIQTGDGMSSPA